MKPLYQSDKISEKNIINYPDAGPSDHAGVYTLFGDYPDMLTMEQMQAALGIGRSTAYKLTRSGALRHIRLGNTIRIPKSELVYYIQKGLQLCHGDHGGWEGSYREGAGA